MVKKVMEQPSGFVVTLYNERQRQHRNQAQKQWADLFVGDSLHQVDILPNEPK